MRVAIDGRRLQDGVRGGVGRGLANLIGPLAGLVDLTVLLDSGRPAPAPEGYVAVPLRRLGSTPEPVWLHTSVAWWLRSHPALFHGVYNAVPLAAPDPTVVTLHDLSWEHHPVDFPSKARRRAFQFQARWAARRSRRVITVSEFVRREIVETYHLDDDRVGVVPNAVDPVFRPVEEDHAAAALERLGVTKPYVVAMGGAQRRRLGTAIEAWQLVGTKLDRRVGLVVVGPEPPAPRPGLVYVGRLPDEQWAAVLSGADALCYPTGYEGFGMPALEAAACGTPVVAAPVASLPEVLGDAAEWCESLEPEAIAKGLVRLLGDPARGRSLRELCISRAAGWPTWSDCAALLVKEYELALS